MSWLILLALAALDPFVAARWCVTRGKLDGKRVNEPKFRAVLPRTDGDDAELRFTYLGPTAVEKNLDSGMSRRQIGLKLRAQDGCNLIYVMWRIAPEARIVVSLKKNPGQRVHAQCGNGGYRNYKPRGGTQPAPIVAGGSHTLRAQLAGKTLEVWADGALAWEGELDEDALSLHGPAGMRSDNGRFDIELRARPGSHGCVPDDDE